MALAEKTIDWNRRRYFDPTEEHEVPDAISYSACQAGAMVKAKAVVALSIHGNIPRLLSRYRPEARIVTFSTEESTVRRCCLLWGVEAYHIEKFYSHLDASTQGLREILVNKAKLAEGDKIVLTSGVPFSMKVPTNTLTIETI